MADDVSNEILAALGYIVLEYTGGGRFAVLGQTPAWAASFPRLVSNTTVHVLDLMDIFPVLEIGFMNFDELWIDTTKIADLGEWVEAKGTAGDLYLKASSMSVRDRRFLTVHAIDRNTIDLIRRARSNQFDRGTT